MCVSSFFLVLKIRRDVYIHSNEYKGEILTKEETSVRVAKKSSGNSCQAPDSGVHTPHLSMCSLSAAEEGKAEARRFSFSSKRSPVAVDFFLRSFHAFSLFREMERERLRRDGDWTVFHVEKLSRGGLPQTSMRKEAFLLEKETTRGREEKERNTGEERRLSPWETP